MKTYIVYFDGEEVGTIKAASHNVAEKKAQKNANRIFKANPWLPKKRLLSRHDN